ncbi:jg1211 [Pararge aegeria aegeria]|uniref:Jg1211 protein n=1 Tax=Pararge aegeria aegeria TaxID=348720 RepID=A0A8S4R9X0_9NEOP|nr:jg1211 [Pararge aegeria aegeria]
MSDRITGRVDIKKVLISKTERLQTYYTNTRIVYAILIALITAVNPGNSIFYRLLVLDKCKAFLRREINSNVHERPHGTCEIYIHAAIRGVISRPRKGWRTAPGGQIACGLDRAGSPRLQRYVGNGRAHFMHA